MKGTSTKAYRVWYKTPGKDKQYAIVMATTAREAMNKLRMEMPHVKVSIAWKI